MASAQDFTAMVARFDTETTRLGVLIDGYVAALASGGATAAEETAALAGLSAVADRLALLGHNVNDPIPPV
jgi:hypothetical protein